MKTDEKGCSTCPKGKEQWESFKDSRKREFVQYDYRDSDGELFSTVASSLDIARERKADWLVRKLVKLYQDDPNCRPELWIRTAGATDQESELFIVMVKQTVLGMKLSDLSAKDITEELTDIRKDISAIDEYNGGNITLSEFRQLTTFTPKDRIKLRWAIQVLLEERVKRSENPYYKVWDSIEKYYMLDGKGMEASFSFQYGAEKLRDEYLQAGNYPEKPMSVLQIHLFKGGKFIEICG